MSRPKIAVPFQVFSRGITDAGAMLLCVAAVLVPVGARCQQLPVTLAAVTEPAGVAAAVSVAPMPGRISGTVKDVTGAIVPGAKVALMVEGAADAREVVSGSDGSFAFEAVLTGPYSVRVTDEGFEPWSTSGRVAAGEDLLLPEIALPMRAASTAVEVSASRQEIAAAQLGFAEKQRVLGVIPNFYASYVWDAAPLTPKQKFSLAWRFATDPVAIAMSAGIAGSQQAENSFSGYGQGTIGYAKRFGATYADGFNSTMLGQAILPVMFHQDPRYFVKGTGTIRARAMYAIATTVMCRGDNGRWQVNYSNILGNVASAGLSNAYYPASSRHGAGLTVETSLITTASGAVGGLIQEFLLHKLTPNIPDYSGH